MKVKLQCVAPSLIKHYMPVKDDDFKKFAGITADDEAAHIQTFVDCMRSSGKDKVKKIVLYLN